MFLYDTDEQHQAVLTDFLRQGLEHGDKVLYLADAPTAESILSYLRAVDRSPETYMSSGQLVIVPVHQSLLEPGAFHLDQAVSLMQEAAERALREGYRGVRISAEMTWALEGVPGSDRLVEFEHCVNGLLPGSPVIGFCQYDRRRLSSAQLLELQRAHQGIVEADAIEDVLLEITKVEFPAGLRLMGEIDLSNFAVFAEALASALRPGEDLYLDLAALKFVDVATVRFLAQTAMSLGDGGRLVLRSPSPLVLKMLHLCGWDDLPNLCVMEGGDAHA